MFIDLGNLSALRTCRVFRALKTVAIVPGTSILYSINTNRLLCLLSPSCPLPPAPFSPFSLPIPVSPRLLLLAFFRPSSPFLLSPLPPFLFYPSSPILLSFSLKPFLLSPASPSLHLALLPPLSLLTLSPPLPSLPSPYPHTHLFPTPLSNPLSGVMGGW